MGTCLFHSHYLVTGQHATIHNSCEDYEGPLKALVHDRDSVSFLKVELYT
jgi:hypothetical protein